ncbi:MAG TPA: pilin [Gammaproteobacteria bacterium]|nr:pilin [Gammaproteobacteria bacterium]
MYCQRCGAQNADRAAYCSGCGQPLAPAAPEAPLPTDHELFELAIGPNNTDYYLSRFERFAQGGSTASWNWPAFFVTLPWLLYRKMWGYAALYFFAPAIFLLVVSLILGAAFSSATAAWLVWPLGFLLLFIFVPMYANLLYYRNVAGRIAWIKRLKGGADRQLRALASEGGTSVAALLILLVLPFGALPVLGILAAIAIPAYQDYTIRAQVSEGLMMAAPVRAAVTETIQREGVVPQDRADAGLTADPGDSQGKYTESIAVDDGRIDITLGGEANQAIHGRVLSLTPYATDDGIAWRCGMGPAPSRQPLAEYQPGSLAADLPKYVPSACRPGGNVP